MVLSAKIKMIPKDKQLHIVIVDDNYDDHFFMKKALSEYPNILVTSLFNGQDIVDFLHRKNEFANSDLPAPDIVLLDINMPKLNGFEVSELLTHEEKFRGIHFVVLSSSLLKTFDKCRNISCHQKPLMADKYKELLETIIGEWQKKSTGVK
jgi:CheY-like chemotaxis protein